MPRGETVWLDEIESALHDLGREGTPKQIASAISARGNLPYELKGATIRGIIYKHPSIFYKIRHGLWGFVSDLKKNPQPFEIAETKGTEAVTERVDRTARNSASARVVPRRQRNLLRRQEVERIAIETTDSHFRKSFYQVRSVEKDNVGWDLEAVGGGERLLLEVKGLSQSTICVDLTPNEFRQMDAYRQVYRICVVTDALKKPKLSVFSWSSENHHWEDEAGGRLEIKIIESARLTAVSES